MLDHIEIIQKDISPNTRKPRLIVLLYKDNLKKYIWEINDTELHGRGTTQITLQPVQKFRVGSCHSNLSVLDGAFPPQ